MLQLHPLADLAIAAGCYVVGAAVVAGLHGRRLRVTAMGGGAWLPFLVFLMCLGTLHLLQAIGLTPREHVVAATFEVLAGLGALATAVFLPPLIASRDPEPATTPAAAVGPTNGPLVESPQPASPKDAATLAMEATMRARQLERTLQEKQTLLQEVHHRVKGNLQTITSLLKLRARRVHDPAARMVLEESVNRVRTMAVLHETLYRSGNPARVELGDYLRSLLGHLFRSQDADLSVLEIDTPPGTPSVDLERAIPLGLLVHELVSNALRHAFPDGRLGRIRVSLSRLPGGALRLEVEDHGVGLPSGMETGTSSSLGLQLAHSLAEQLGSSLNIERNGGTRFSLTLHDIEEVPA